jgi:acyl-coenzyme A synthetase/AMP-(fatty) acid ligase
MFWPGSAMRSSFVPPEVSRSSLCTLACTILTLRLWKGPVNPEVASKVNEVVRVLNLTGTTEGLFIGNLVVERQDWHWFAFHPYSGFEFKEIEPGVFEHWIHRNKHWELFQGIFQTFPNKDSINLKDIYIQNPSNPNLWAFKGRSDDVVVLSNGYKISPLVMETFISTHPAIDGCVMVRPPIL